MYTMEHLWNKMGVLFMNCPINDLWNESPIKFSNVSVGMNFESKKRHTKNLVKSPFDIRYSQLPEMYASKCDIAQKCTEYQLRGKMLKHLLVQWVITLYWSWRCCLWRCSAVCVHNVKNRQHTRIRKQKSQKAPLSPINKLKHDQKRQISNANEFYTSKSLRHAF